MEGTLLFIHGTGVRAAKYAESLRLIEERVRNLRLSVQVAGCFWGEAEGARLSAEGRSIPTYEAAGGGKIDEQESAMAMWSLLYTDPWYELRLLRHFPRQASPIAIGEEAPAVRMRRAVKEYVPNADVTAALNGTQLAPYFGPALDDLRSSAELDDAAATAPPDPLEHRRAIARALVAATIVSAEDAGVPAPAGAGRDALVAAITDDLHGYGMGFGDFLLSPVKGLAARVATRKLVADRGSITDATSPAAGDILRFLARGDGVRRFLRSAIRDHEDQPIYLLGHSLGGIMCVDLLVREQISAVKGLITVGSQAPFLYEIGALPSLLHPDELPAHFPRWLNIFDKRDILSYIGSGIFENAVTDVEVDNGQPFPQSHSAYWTNPRVWRAITEFLP